MIVHLNVPIFSSPTHPIGAAAGRVFMCKAPKEGDVFHWRSLIDDSSSKLIAKLGTSRVDYTDASPQMKLVDIVVGLDGVFLNSEEAARDVVHQLQASLGLIYCDY